MEVLIPIALGLFVLWMLYRMYGERVFHAKPAADSSGASKQILSGATDPAGAGTGSNGSQGILSGATYNPGGSVKSALQYQLDSKRQHMIEAQKMCQMDSDFTACINRRCNRSAASPDLYVC